MKDNADTNHRRPQFRVSDGDLVQTHEPARKPSESEAGGNQTQKEYQGNRDESTPLVQPIQDFLWQNTETYPFISRRFSRMTGGIDNPKPPDGDELERQLRLTQKLIGAFGQEARKSDADVLVVGIPTRGEIHPERPVSYLPEDGRPYWQSQRKMLENLSRRSENIEFLDLRPALRRAADRGALVYGRQNGHLNKKGHRIAAMTVHKWLIERGYVPARDIEYKSSFDLNRTTC